MVTLRPYQEDIVQRIYREFEAQEKRLLVVMPTGAGKTVVFSQITRDHSMGGTLIISHRSEIIDQTCAKLDALGLHYGVIQAGKDKKLRSLADIQVASIQTLHARAIRSNAMLLPRADLIILDECQHAPASTYQRVLEKYPNARVLGFTATPCRGDGRGLGSIFDKLVEGPQVPDLIDLGFLVPSVVYSKRIDLRGVLTVAGDYNRGQLEQRMDTDALVGDVVTEWLKRGDDRSTVVFASGVAHSRHIVGEFLASNIPAEHLDGTTPKDVREAILARLASRETKIVSNAMVLTEGWDCPSIGCCVLARPTKHQGLFRQMIGRALRPADGKAKAIIIDHAGAVYEHGKPEDRIEWTLDPDDKAHCPQHEKRRQDSKSAFLDCTQCGALRAGGLPCPACGFLPQRPKEYRPFIDEDLIEVGSTSSLSHAEKQEFYLQLRYIREREHPSWSPKQPAAVYRQKFGSWPPFSWNDLPPCDPTPAVRSYVRSRQIAYAKANNRPANGVAA